MAHHNQVGETHTTFGGEGRLASALHALLRRPAPRGGMVAAMLALRLTSAGLLGYIGWVHWHLWQLGYQHIPTDGPFFLLDAIVAVVLALALLAWPRVLTALAAAGFVASTIIALIISLSVGLFGFRESISASYVVVSLILESAAVLTLVAWAVLALSAVAPRAGAARESSLSLR
jgi:hypothetical protein